MEERAREPAATPAAASAEPTGVGPAAAATAATLETIAVARADARCCPVDGSSTGTPTVNGSLTLPPVPVVGCAVPSRAARRRTLAPDGAEAAEGSEALVENSAAPSTMLGPLIWRAAARPWAKAAEIFANSAPVGWLGRVKLTPVCGRGAQARFLEEEQALFPSQWCGRTQGVGAATHLTPG